MPATTPRTLSTAPAKTDLDTTRWAVVIPSFNHATDTIACLESLRKADDAPGRIIVVDDASTEDAVGEIADWARKNDVTHEVVGAHSLALPQALHKWLTVVVSPTNSGFSVSSNTGLRYIRDHTDAPFVLLLNNDAAVSRSYFRDLAAGIAMSGSVGLATGTIYEWDQKTVWYAGGRFNPMRVIAEHRLEIPVEGSPQSTEFVCGCTMLISRAVLETVGLLPECYSPCYCEDVDYSLAVVRAGMPLTYIPNAKALHRVGSSLGREERSPNVIYWFNRNRSYALRRNYRGWQRVAGIAYLVLSRPARALSEVLHGRPKNAAAFIRGTAAGLLAPIPSSP